jgi:hypothetical protein
VLTGVGTEVTGCGTGTVVLVVVVTVEVKGTHFSVPPKTEVEAAPPPNCLVGAPEFSFAGCFPQSIFSLAAFGFNHLQDEML